MIVDLVVLGTAVLLGLFGRALRRETEQLNAAREVQLGIKGVLS